MLVVHGTKKFRDRVGGPLVDPSEQSSTALGNWYATVLFWRPQVALFVNETTLLPVLLPFAPARSVIERFTPTLASVLGAHGVAVSFIDYEVAEMGEHGLAKTANRSVLGVMNEFALEAEVEREDSFEPESLVWLSVRLARMPCGPLYDRHVSPDRELAALAGAHLTGGRGLRPTL